MAYVVRCDTCTLDREFADWADATWYASSHETEYADHWASVHELAEA